MIILLYTTTTGTGSTLITDIIRPIYGRSTGGDDGSMKFLLEDGFLIVGLEFRLEVIRRMTGAAVGPTTWVRQVVGGVLEFIAVASPTVGLNEW